MAYLEYEAQLCPGCSGYIPETTDPGAKYVADLPHRCFRCDAVLKKKGDYREQLRAEALVLWPVQQKT